MEELLTLKTEELLTLETDELLTPETEELLTPETEELLTFEAEELLGGTVPCPMNSMATMDFAGRVVETVLLET